MRGIRRNSIAGAMAVTALLVPIATLAILVRHDRPEAAYRELGQRYERSLAWVRARDATGIVVAEATLIAPRFALTAAHVGSNLGPGDSLVVAGRPHAVRRVVVHPGWDPDAWTHDLAVVELETCVEGGVPIPLYRWDDEEGQAIVVVGRGMTGTGLTGPVEDDGVIRGATNRIDAVLGEWLRFTFDGPESDDATDLEGISGPGDSGGPAILERDGTAWLAGVSSAQDDSATGGRPGRYGVHEYYARVSVYRSWIEGIVDGARDEEETAGR